MSPPLASGHPPAGMSGTGTVLPLTRLSLPTHGGSATVFPGTQASVSAGGTTRASTAQGLYVSGGMVQRTESPGAVGSEFVLTVGEDEDDEEDDSEYANDQRQKQRLVREKHLETGAEWGLGRCDSGQCQPSEVRRERTRRIPWYKDGCFLSKAAIFLVVLVWIALVMVMVISYDPTTEAATPAATPSAP